MLTDISYFPPRSSIKYVELLAAIAGTIYFYKYRGMFLKYFLLILWYTVINEFSGLILEKMGVRTNVIIYNIYHLINFSFLFLVFRIYVKKDILKKCITLFMGLYILSFFVNLIFENYLVRVQTVPFFIAAIGIIISVLFYFSQVLNTNEVLYVRQNLLFWISVGYLLYLSGSLPIRVIRNFYTDAYSSETLKYILDASGLLSIVMNICFILGFIWHKKDQQYS